ncbi:diacylglycerol kinase family protein [Streptomyces sp. NPDC054765]
MVIDPVARSTDGESVRIAKDVLCAGAGAKICLPDGPEEFARILARRGHRRPVVIGDDRTLLRVVGLLHKERELAAVPLSMVPVGAPAAVALSRALGIPTDTVAAARAVLDGGERPMDLLTDDSDGIVLGGLRIPCGSEATRHGHGVHVPVPSPAVAPADPVAAVEGRDAPAGGPDGHRPWWKPAARTARTALALLAAPAAGLGGRRVRVPGQRLRIEADGVLLADLDRPVRGVSVMPGGQVRADGPRPGAAGELAEVVVHWPGGSRPVRTRARAVTVSGADFHYRADAVVGGPVRTRTWTLQPGAWRLQLPRE